MGFALRKRTEAPGRDGIVEFLQRLWQTKLNSIALLEQWLKETGDAEVRAGLANQLVDERRHLRLVGEELRRLGGRIQGGIDRDTLMRPFLEVRTRGSDWQRLFAYYRGIKSFTIDRCAHVIPLVDGALAQALDQIARDEERHVRWADLRLQRLLNSERLRECQMQLGRVRNGLESVWGRSVRHLRLVSSR